MLVASKNVVVELTSACVQMTLIMLLDMVLRLHVAHVIWEVMFLSDRHYVVY